MPFPALPHDWEPTRATLHAHARTLGVVARSHVPAHPKWWHVSLTVTDTGLTTDPIDLPGGGVVGITLDLSTHAITLKVDGEPHTHYPLVQGERPRATADRLFADLAAIGLADDGYDLARLGTDPDTESAYDPAHSEAFFAALRAVAEALESERARRDGTTGPVQVWPHGFDIAFEWFGTRLVEDGESASAQPAQLNLGWYPAGEAYFYSNPWPFDDALLGVPLPAGAVWHTDGWKGTMLPYTEVAGRPDGEERFARYATAVYAAAAPTLMA